MADTASITIEESDTPAKLEDYVIVDNTYRLVHPYYFDFVCNVKQRWEGRNIIDIFSQEFAAKDRDYYISALSSGKLRVENNTNITPDTPLLSGMCMRHLVHRHEPPVPALPISVITMDEDIVAVCKPHGLPVHVSGQYRKNTVLGILTAERPEIGPLLPVHRLDKPVSGVLLFARSSTAANVLRKRIEGHEVEKVYVARVLGRVAMEVGETVRVEAALSWDPKTNMAFVVPDDKIVGSGGLDGANGAVDGDREKKDINECIGKEQQQEESAKPENAEHTTLQTQQQQQLHQDSQPEPPTADTDNPIDPTGKKRKRKPKNPLAKAERIAAAQAQKGKTKDPYSEARPAATLVTCLGISPDGQTSLVECQPLTGRTHQIRVHLAHLGHPIANDRQYGGTYNGPASARQLSKELGVLWGHASTSREAVQGGDSCSLKGGGGEAGLPSEFPALMSMCVEEPLRDPLCTHCPGLVVKDYPVDMRPLWLHARRYTFDGRGFEAELPPWADFWFVPAS